MKFIGMDAHSSNSNFCVVNEQGVVVDNATIQTNGRLLVNYLRGIEGPKKLTFEECELSQWLYAILHKETDELIVCNPVANITYKKAKTDKLDAMHLAQLLRGGFLEGVYHQGCGRERLRGLMSGYEDLVSDAVRLKNRYKSLFRKTGQEAKGKDVYQDKSFLEGLERSELKFVGHHALDRLMMMEQQRQEYRKEIIKVSKGFKEIKLLKTIPGIGDIRAAQITSQVIDPNRFANKYKYFSYCGLARHKRMSGGNQYGSTKIHGNRTLKCVYRMAGHSALRGTGALKEYYDQLRSRGTSDKNAIQAVCRKIAAISLSIWRHGKAYDEKMISGPLKQAK